MERSNKVTFSSSVSREADRALDRMVTSKAFANRSNAVENSVLLMNFVLNNEQIMGKAREMGIIQ